MRIVHRRSGASVLLGVGCGLLVFAALKSGAQAQESSDLISLQARVLQDGVPANQDLDLTFEIYETSTGGLPIFSEAQDAVPCRNGILSVRLGVNTALGNIFKGGYSTSDRFVAIKLDGNEIVPRIRLTAVPYAHRASSADVSSMSIKLSDGGSGLAFSDFETRYVNNASEIAGAGLEDDGSGGDGALRIASSAAGDGLTGGSGSPLAVGAGNGITVSADTIAVNTAALINGYGGAGPAVIDGDRLEIDFTPSTYTRSTGGGADVKDLTAHLQGIDAFLGGVGGSGSGSGITNVVLRVFASSGTYTYTPTTGMVRCLVICTGGGGGGGGADGDGSVGQATAGGGGGGGSTTIAVLTSTAVGASKSVTIGANGSGGSSSGGAGGAGQQTSLGSLVTAPGGNGGAGAIGSGGGSFVGGTGGTGGSTSTSSLLGSNGGRGNTGFIVANAPPGLSQGGDGGGSFWSSGGSGATKTHVSAGASPGHAGDSYGAGGGGAGHVNSTSGAAGGAGKAGVCVIVEYCQ